MSKNTMVIDENNILYVPVEMKHSGINRLVSFIDGIRSVQFDKRPTRRYFYAEDVIKWHRKELQEVPDGDGNEEFANFLEDCLAKIKDGTFEVSEPKGSKS